LQTRHGRAAVVQIRQNNRYVMSRKLGNGIGYCLLKLHDDIGLRAAGQSNQRLFNHILGPAIFIILNTRLLKVARPTLKFGLPIP